jgi:hypothetical protein
VTGELPKGLHSFGGSKHFRIHGHIFCLTVLRFIQVNFFTLKVGLLPNEIELLADPHTRAKGSCAFVEVGIVWELLADHFPKRILFLVL